MYIHFFFWITWERMPCQGILSSLECFEFSGQLMGDLLFFLPFSPLFLPSSIIIKNEKLLWEMCGTNSFGFSSLIQFRTCFSRATRNFSDTTWCYLSMLFLHVVLAFGLDRGWRHAGIMVVYSPTGMSFYQSKLGVCTLRSISHPKSLKLTLF